jgi:hypothetical protein
MEYKHCKNCRYCIDYLDPGAGRFIYDGGRFYVDSDSTRVDWHPSHVACIPTDWEGKECGGGPVIRKNIRSCSNFKVKGKIRNVWKK